MKKLVLALSVLCATAFVSKAQMAAGDFKFGAGLHLGLPVGTFHNGYSFGIGGELQGEYAFTEQVTGIATSGYTSFFGKTQDLGGGFTYKAPATGQIPIIVGPRFYPSEQFFVGAQIGLGIFTGGGSSTSGFEYRPQIGYNGDMFQLTLSYDGVSVTGGTFSHIGLSAIYKFGGGK